MGRLWTAVKVLSKVHLEQRRIVVPLKIVDKGVRALASRDHQRRRLCPHADSHQPTQPQLSPLPHREACTGCLHLHNRKPGLWKKQTHTHHTHTPHTSHTTHTSHTHHTHHTHTTQHTTHTQHTHMAPTHSHSEERGGCSYRRSDLVLKPSAVINVLFQSCAPLQQARRPRVPAFSTT